MKTRDDQLELAQRVCDDALAGKLTLERFYAVVGDVAAFSDFPKMVVGDVLDFIEHETEGQEWQKHDILVDRLLLNKGIADERCIEARTWLRRNLRVDIDVAKQVDECLDRLAAR